MDELEDEMASDDDAGSVGRARRREEVVVKKIEAEGLASPVVEVVETVKLPANMASPTSPAGSTASTGSKYKLIGKMRGFFGAL
jgi:hypothetical protein